MTKTDKTFLKELKAIEKKSFEDFIQKVKESEMPIRAKEFIEGFIKKEFIKVRSTKFLKPFEEIEEKSLDEQVKIVKQHCNDAKYALDELVKWEIDDDKKEMFRIFLLHYFAHFKMLNTKLKKGLVSLTYKRKSKKK